MSGGFAYQQYGPQRAKPAVLRLVAAALLVVAAGIGVGGSFATFSTYTSQYFSDVDPEYSDEEPSVYRSNGWESTVEPAPETPVTSVAPLVGIPIVVAGAVAFLGALLLVLTARRPDDPAAGRLLGVGASGLLCGAVAVVLIGNLTEVRNVTASAEAFPDSGFRSSIELGPGFWLLLVAGVVALAAAVLLLVPRRAAPAAPFPGHGVAPPPPYGPGQAQPWYGTPPAGPQQPDPGAPPPGWAGPPHHAG
jgi:hypothetical protein